MTHSFLGVGSGKSGETAARGREVLGRIALTLTHTVASEFASLYGSTAFDCGIAGVCLTELVPTDFGLIVMKHGEYGDELYLIEEGEVDVYRPTIHSNHEVDTDAILDWRMGLGVVSHCAVVLAICHKV
jgi:hypothetical protein